MELKSGMFMVKNFLCCLSLRAGIVFISWWTFLYSFFGLIICFLTELSEGTGLLSFISALLLCGTILSARTLWYLPVPGKKYSTTSVNARSLIHFTIYQACLTMLALPVFVYACLWAASEIKNVDIRANRFLGAIMWETLFTGWQVHCISVMYSYHLMLTKADETVSYVFPNDLDLTTNDGNLQPSAPIYVKTEPVYSECASAADDDPNYVVLKSATTSKKTDFNDFV